MWNDMLTERQYFLVLPSADLEGYAPLAATYADATAMTRALTARLDSSLLRPSDKGALIREECISYWTEH